MRRKATIVVLGIVLAACGFEHEQFAGDADVGPVTVGFAQTTSLQDESSGAIQVIVRLSRPAPEPIAVAYAFTGGTATNPEDYTGMDGTLSFATGQTDLGIELTIAVDAMEEEDETIELTLSSPSGAELGSAHHTVTISKALLPRVNFATDMSDALEDTNITLEITLDSAPQLESTVTFAYKNTGTAGLGFDWSMPMNATVTFPVNTLTQTVTIPVMNDLVDEDDETVVFELATTTNVIIGPNKERTHTIHDNDNAPSVSISAAAVTPEGTGSATTATVTVTLSGPSGKLVTVPVTFGGGTATEGTDYDYVSKADLVFTPNQNPAVSEITKTVMISITGDAIDENDQTIITSLSTMPTNATLSATLPLTQTQTIMDDDAAPTVVFTTANGSSTEGDSGTVTTSYTLTLSAASEKSIGFDIGLTGTATYPSDYTSVPAATMVGAGMVAHMTIAPAATTVNLDLVVKGDTDNEGADETIIMNILMNANLVNVTRGAAAGLTRTHTINDFDP